jgi:hypothetical protein
MSRAERRQARLRAEVNAALAEFAAAVEVRLHAEIAQNRRTQVELIHALQALRLDIAGRDAELARAVQQSGAAVEHAAARIEQERLDRHALVEAVGSLTEAVTGRAISPPELPRLAPHSVGSGNGIVPPVLPGSGPMLPRNERLVGGRVSGPAPGSAGPGADGDAKPEAHTGGATANAPLAREVEKVECLVDGTWEGGYDVMQILKAGDVVQYRVRRPDGRLLDHLLEGNEVRHRPRAPKEPDKQPVPAGARPSIYWTRS